MRRSVKKISKLLIYWLTFQGVFALNTDVNNSGEFTTAYSTAVAGDTIVVKAMLDFGKDQVLLDRSGEAGNPIVIKADGAARVACSTGNRSDGAYTITGNHIEFQNLSFRAEGQPFSGSHPFFSNPYPEKPGGNKPWGLLPSPYNNMKIEKAKGIVFKNCEWQYGWQYVITANQSQFEMYNCDIDNLSSRWGISSKVIFMTQCYEIKMVNCKFLWNMPVTSHAIGLSGGTFPDSGFGEKWLVEGCTFSYPTPKGESWHESILEVGAPGLGMHPNHSVIFRYNLFAHCAYTAITLRGGTNVDIVNNTFVNCGVNPNWEDATPVKWESIGIIRISNPEPEAGFSRRVREINVANNIFWSNHGANKAAGKIYMVDAFVRDSSTWSTEGILKFNMDGNQVWHTDTAISAVNNRAADDTSTGLIFLPVIHQNTTVKDPMFVNGTGDLTGDYTPDAAGLSPPATFKGKSLWQPVTMGIDPAGQPIKAGYIGAINPDPTTFNVDLVIEKDPDAGVKQLIQGTPTFIGMSIAPNPFKGSTGHIYFTLTQAEDIKLALYDVQGRMVKVIESGKFSAGKWATPVFYKDLAAGHYIARLTGRNGKILAAQKMIIQK